MIELTDLAKGVRSAALRDLIDSGAGVARIDFHPGPQPDLGDAAGALLARIDLVSPCGVVNVDELELEVPPWVVVLATGRIAWARLLNRDGAIVSDMVVGIIGSGAAIEVNTLDVVAAGLLAITSARLRE